MIEVSLEQLVNVADTEHLWPEQFRDFINTLKEDAERPHEAQLGRWLAFADYLQDIDEPGMKRVALYVGARPSVKASNLPNNPGLWRWNGLPDSIRACRKSEAVREFVMLLPQLAVALRKHDEEGA